MSKLRTGMGFTELAYLVNRPKQVGTVRIWDVGATWKDIHIAPGSYDWSLLDRLVAEAAGERIVYVICSTPRWAAMDPDAPHYAPWLGPGTNSLPGDLDASWKPFVANLSQRYKGKIHAYEIWNEPQLADFLYPYETKQLNLLAQMTKDAARIIRGNDPQAEVWGASVLPRKSSGGMKKAGKYLSALASKKVKLDGYACHIYPTVGDAGSMGAMLKEVRAAVPAGSPVHVTECAVDLLGPVQSNAAYLEKAVASLYKAAKKGEEIIWYAWKRPDLGGALLDDGTPLWRAILNRK